MVKIYKKKVPNSICVSFIWAQLPPREKKFDENVTQNLNFNTVKLNYIIYIVLKKQAKTDK